MVIRSNRTGLTHLIDGLRMAYSVPLCLRRLVDREVDIKKTIPFFDWDRIPSYDAMGVG